MKVLLRFCKVTKIEKNTVAVTGVNLPTVKHVEMVFERIDDPTLTQLRTAMLAGLFIRVLGTEKGVHFSNEDPSESYFLAFSFARQAGYNPPFMKKLDDYLVTMESWRAPVTDLGVFVLNLMDKLGNVYYARDQILEENSKDIPSHPIVRYHVLNSVTSCKACFDALAGVLNEVYAIGHKKGKIDLASTRSDLIEDVKNMNKTLGRKLEQFQSWINRITEYRDKMQHRIMLLTPIVGKEELKCKVPFKPVFIGDPTMSLFAAKKIPYQDAEDFCHELIDNITKLIEIIFVDLIQMLSSRTYMPT